MENNILIGDMSMKSDVKTLNIYCDGGFGNRFNALTVGLLIAKVGNFKPVIFWPSTNWCRSLFKNIFKNDYNVINCNLNYFQKNFKDYVFVMHSNSANLPCQIKHPNYFSSIQNIADYYNQSNKQKFVYNNDTIPDYCSNNDLKQIVKDIKFTDKIVDKVNQFTKNINDEFIGIHLRNTDFHDNEKRKFDQIESLVKINPGINYFICSDDEKLEERFTKNDNAFAYPKTKYVEKLTDDGGWRDAVVDNEGNEYSFNIERSDQSVIEAMIDLLILSKSTIMNTSESTFLKTALLIQESNA